MELVQSTTVREMCFGEYVAVRHIATGGMAEIYLARDKRSKVTELQRLFVVKQLLPSLAGTSSFLNMFIDEARIAQRLNHPNIVRVFDTGQVEDSYFFSMEFLHGHALPAVHKQLWQHHRGLQTAHAVGIVIQLCAALGYAHDRCCDDGEPLNIVHRDISHSNVHLTYDGTVKLLDFGIARARNRIEETRTGVLKGKIRYMSPEQAFSSEIDRRSDIFSLSILLWELTVGRQLFDQKADFEILRAIGGADARRPSQVRANYPAKLEAIVMKGLQRDPANRYQTAGELSDALMGFAEELHLDTSPESLSDLMLELFSDDAEAACEASSEYARCVEQLATTTTDDSDDDSYQVIEVNFDDDGEYTMSAPDTTLACAVLGSPSQQQSVGVFGILVLAMCVSVGVFMMLNHVSNNGGIL